MLNLRPLLPLLVAAAAQAQGIYQQPDKPDDPVCMRLNREKFVGNARENSPRTPSRLPSNVPVTTAMAVQQAQEDAQKKDRDNAAGTRSGVRAGENLLSEEVSGIRHAFFPPAQRREVTAFAVVDSKGRALPISNLRGKVVVVGLWSTHCQPSAKMMMELVDVYARREKFGFEVLAVNFDDLRGDELAQNAGGAPTRTGWQSIHAFLARNKDFFKGGTLPVYLPGVGSQGASQLVEDPSALPILLVVDREGRLASMDVGYEPNFVAKSLGRILKEGPPPAGK